MSAIITIKKEKILVLIVSKKDSSEEEHWPHNRRWNGTERNWTNWGTSCSPLSWTYRSSTELRAQSLGDPIYFCPMSLDPINAQRSESESVVRCSLVLGAAAAFASCVFARRPNALKWWRSCKRAALPSWRNSHQLVPIPANNLPPISFSFFEETTPEAVIWRHFFLKRCQIANLTSSDRRRFQRA